VLDGELAVPCNPKSAHAGLKILQENSDTTCSCVASGVDMDLT